MYAQGEKVPPIDVDIALLCVNQGQLAEMMQLLYRHRHSSRTVRTMNSSHDTVIRLCAQYKRYDLAIKLLTDTVRARNALFNHFLSTAD